MHGRRHPHLRKARVVAAVALGREAFIPGGSPYLGQTILGEPLRQINVLPSNRRLS
jgi:hypothetical protein